MKRFFTLNILLFAFTAMAQNPYQNLWESVAKFENQGLTQSAAKVVDTIYQNAKTNKHQQQRIKALLHKSKYMLILEEDAQLKVINNFKTEIKDANTLVSKRLLQNMLATMYWQYFQQNRYKFYNRTKTAEKVNDDFRTWDLQTLFNEIHHYYQQSLNNALLLQQEPLSNYKMLLVEGENTKTLRPTLYDLLSHNALQFYKTDENSLTQPTYKFSIDNSAYIANSEVFIDEVLSTKDSISLQFNALKIYQNLLKFHRKNKNAKAHAVLNIERINFVYSKAIFENKTQHLEQTLKHYISNLKGNKNSALYSFELAKLYANQGKSYNAKDKFEEAHDTNRWKRKDALSICNQVINDYPESDGAKQCQTLKQSILRPEISLKTESYIPTNLPFRALVNYRNLEELQFNIYKLSQKQLESFNKIYDAKKKANYLKKLNLVNSVKTTLKSEGDYQKHSTEVILPKLPNGLYLVQANTQTTENVFALAHIQVTDLALIEHTHQDFHSYQLINRNNGKPIANAAITFNYKVKYNGSWRKKDLTTNAFGKFTIPKGNTYYRSIKITAKHQDQTAYFGDYYIYKKYKRNAPKPHYRNHLFTDRSIYRPSQTVYFKTILTKTHQGNTEVMANHNFTATLHNVNDEKISELKLTTNEFGAASGEFVLPNDGLTGEFYIKISSNNFSGNRTYFLVEEYKRPKFKPEFLPITQTFKINDSITVKGKAIAFAGSNITNAKVVYKVKRKVQYPKWHYWHRPPYNSEAQEITFGETKTNQNGEFTISFKALPDDSVAKDQLPIFNYEVSADITDINGETRSTSTIVKVGYHSMTLSVTAPNQINKDQKNTQLSITSQNLNGEFAPAKGRLSIYKLQAPKNVLRSRPWQAPDYQVIDKDTFKKHFPNEAYNNEFYSENWEKGEPIFTTNFNTEKNKTIDLKKLKKWQSGMYKIVVESQDKFGQTLKDETTTTLFSPKDKTLADQQLFSAQLDKQSYNAGENALLTIGSAAKNITVTIEVEKNKTIIHTQLITLNNNKKQIEIPVLESDLGGFVVHCSYAAFNHYKNQSVAVNVPYPNTDLQIETQTFRDKLQPAQDETWRFTIKGNKGNKVTAELLASMYDASLDEFKTHNWRFNPLQKSNYWASINKRKHNSFGTTNFRRYNNFNYSKTYAQSQRYDQLNWFGLYFGSMNYERRQYLRRKRNNKPSSYTSEYKSSIKKGTIKGVVIMANDNEPLPSANVIIKGTSKGVLTDFDGAFSIEAKPSDKIVVSYVGLQTLEFKVDNANYFKIRLEDDSNSLDEVVVVGYDTQTKEAYTGSATAIAEEAEIDAGYLQVLDGEVAGVSVTDTLETLSIRGNSSVDNDLALIVIDGKVYDGFLDDLDAKTIKAINVLKGANATALYGSRGADGVILITTKSGSNNTLAQVKARKNLQETAFFFPHLQTDKAGNVSFKFKAPEALTQWKLQLLAHTKTLHSAIKQLNLVTQKELMVLPNVPRFLRENDTITISTKIANLTKKALSGKAQLILTDAITGKVINTTLHSSSPSGKLEGAFSSFSVEAKGNTQVSWQFAIPKDIQAIQYKIVAQSGDFSDGEESVLPVLSNRMLVTETMPMWLRSNQTKTFTLNKLKNNTSTTLSNHKLSLEITSNPAWYAVQALPYLMEYPYACNEQTFSRYYANALAQHIVTANPKIEAVFKQWSASANSKDALLSNLEKNQELKSLLIQETPWLRDAQSESDQKKRIALLFDFNKMKNELNTALRQLKNNQMASGAWAWFNGGRDNRYITQHIINGFGHLKQLGVVDNSDNKAMIKNAIKYLDLEFVKEYNDLKKYNKKIDYTKNHLSHTQLHYLYMRSFYPELKPSKQIEKIMAYYKSQIKSYWLKRSLYNKGLMALIMHRMNENETAKSILKSLKENSITSDELGMYWKANTNSWYWYQAPIETQALMIEAFAEVGHLIQNEAKNTETIDNLKIWLLKNKQTNQWKTTKATTEAVYALLLQGSDWLSVENEVDVKVGGKPIMPSKLNNVKVEAGTGYYKTSWSNTQIKPEMASVTLSKKGKGIAWGALYWQYFEDLDKITASKSPLKLSKKLFLKTNTNTGEEISKITTNTTLKVGDLVRVRIELSTDRAMEFVHLKDMRAAGFEPVNVLSKYKWQDGLGYYESTKDAATNFFIDYLPKGIYVFEYDLRVNNAGNMSNGISTIQSMYAPEFSSHSKGVRVNATQN